MTEPVQGKTAGNLFATETIGKLIAKFSIPAVISLLVNSLYNIVDQIFIGQGVGYLGNAATNVAFPFVTITLAVALMIGDGCAANLSLKLGAGDKEQAKNGFNNALIMMVSWGIFMLLVGLIFLKPLLKLFGATDVVMPFAVDYTGIIVFGLPFVIVGTALNSFIRADGSPKFAMFSMITGAIINTILDPIFIFKFNMGVKGAAIATILGQIATFCISFSYLWRIKSIPFRIRDIRFQPRTCATVASLGLSSFITQMAITLVQITLNNSLTHYGALSVYGREIPLSCMGIVMKVSQILIAVIVGTATGAQPIIGFNYGAHNLDRVKKTYRIAVSITSTFAFLGWLCFMIFPHAIISVFGSESDLYNEFAVKCFRIFLFGIIGAGIQIPTSIFFQAIGKPIKAALLSLSRQVLFLIPLILILPIFAGLEAILYAGPIADFSACTLAIILMVYEIKHNLNQKRVASKAEEEQECLKAVEAE